MGSRLDVTSTGHMLDTQRDGRRSIPANPPQPFDTKSQTEYKQISPFPFSDHDNRNSIQLKGEYLGDVSKAKCINSVQIYLVPS